MKMSSVSKLAIAGALTAGMVIAPLASAEARDWNQGNDRASYNGHYDRGHDYRDHDYRGRDYRGNDHHDNGRNTALALGILGGIIGLAALSSVSDEPVVVHKAPRPVYYAPRYRTVYAYPAPVYGRYAYGY